MTPKVAKAVFRNALLTMLIQFCTAGAYVMLAHNLSPDTTIQNLIAASPYSTRYRKAKARKGLTGSFGDRSWLRKAII